MGGISTDGMGLSATELGQNDASATADTLSDVTTTPAQAKLRLILARLASNAFTATIQGAARTELDVMLNTIATYFSASGAAYSSVVDPGGSTRTEIETVLEDIAKMLAGGGITTYPAAAVPGDQANFAAVIRKIYDLVALIPTTAMRGTDNAALAATALSNAVWTDAKAGFITAAVAVDSTVAKAAAASEARLAELDAANLPADVDKIPKSDGTASWNATALAALQAEAEDALAATASKRLTGRPQVFQVAVTSAANAGDVTLATVTAQAVVIDSIAVKAVTAAQADLTSAAVAGGASKVVVFLSATDAAKANIDAVDEQIAWIGAVELAATKTIVISLVGTGATAVNLLVTITFHAVVDGGYLA